MLGKLFFVDDFCLLDGKGIIVGIDHNQRLAGREETAGSKGCACARRRTGSARAAAGVYGCSRGCG